ncbi:MAG: gliding motility lipoprotein GldH [Bacteroidales bacterium]|nr:gliding motility lipoprotein GldH [Bacteroidales bacterium]
MNRSVYFFLMPILLFLVTSCSDNSIYDHNNELTEPWTVEQKSVFDFEVNDTLSAFNFYINIRNTTDYNYSNLFLFIRTDFPDGRFSVDTAELFLADIKGNWLGSGYGEIKDSQILFRKHGRFPMKGHYKITFEQAMRDPELEGIDAVGIRIEKSE